jgi:hypothetical protein
MGFLASAEQPRLARPWAFGESSLQTFLHEALAEVLHRGAMDPHLDRDRFVCVPF